MTHSFKSNTRNGSALGKVIIFTVLAIIVFVLAELFFVSGEKEESEIQSPATPVVIIDSIAEGKKHYTQYCMACHQTSGLGIEGAFPPLIKNEWVSGNPERTIRVILNGLMGKLTVAGTEYNSLMVPFADSLSDKQIAEILTYIRQDFGNSSGAVDESLVAAVRAEVGSRELSWTQEELAAWAN